MSHIPEAIRFEIGIPTVILMSWVTVGILFILSFLATRRLAPVPKGLQNVFELFFQFITGMVDDIVGPEGKNFYMLFLGLFFYIFCGNLLGLIPGFSSPTANINTTAALALVVFFSTHFFGIRKHGLLKYLNNLTHGVPWWLKPLMFVIEIIGELARPLSLSFRLFGNIMAKELLLGILALLVVMFFPSHNIIQKFLSIVPILLRPFIILLGMFVSFIQAFVFTILSMLYIGGAIKIHNEEAK